MRYGTNGRPYSVYRGDLMEFEVWDFALDNVFSENICVLKFCPFSGFFLVEGPESSVTTPNHHATLQAGTFTDNDAFESHKATEPNGQSNRQGAEKLQSHRGMLTHRETAGEAIELGKMPERS